MTSVTNDGYIAPSELIVPRHLVTQSISGAVWISGSEIHFIPYGGPERRIFISGSIWAATS